MHRLRVSVLSNAFTPQRLQLTINAIFKGTPRKHKSNKSTAVKCFYTAAGGTKTTALTVLTELASIKIDEKTLCCAQWP